MVNTLTTTKMAMVYSHGRVETFIKEAIKMMSETALARCFGQIAVYIKVNGEAAYSTDMAR